jgi:hypothetical protein
MIGKTLGSYQVVAKLGEGGMGDDATNYDVTEDGQRFIMVSRTVESGRSRQQLNVVVNWTEQLKRIARGK